MRGTGLFFLLFAAIILFASDPIRIDTPADADRSIYDNLKLGVPSFQDVIIIDREGFAVGFSPRYKVPLWVCYIVTADEIQNRTAGRSNQFHADPAIAISGKPGDYYKTGYDRGHLVPAADLRFSADCMKESFFMSNIAPQLPVLNRTCWKYLEEAVRINAVKERKLAVVTGVIFHRNEPVRYIGEGIAVPHGFYKVILDLTPPRKAIGFVFKHEQIKLHFTALACSVDAVEKLTGLDFFNRLPADQEAGLERVFSVDAWEFSARMRGGEAPEDP